MLLTSNHSSQSYSNEEVLILQMLAQQRYAEAYVLLKKEQSDEPATQYNLALCHFWAGQYQESLVCLDRAQMALPSPGNRADLLNDQFYAAIRSCQNETPDHLQAVSKKYIIIFGVLLKDAIIRFKTDCWLKLGNYDKVMEIATPIAHKNYKNITEALQIAHQQRL